MFKQARGKLIIAQILNNFFGTLPSIDELFPKKLLRIYSLITLHSLDFHIFNYSFLNKECVPKKTRNRWGRGGNYE